MLGSLTGHSPWRWTAVGKHPAAADYIHLENGSPLMDALADWTAKGYDQITRAARQQRGLYSWRFWLRGTQKSRLICGIVRDSSDRIGRPYPFLVMGEGGLEKWEKRWESLPQSLARTWQRMESLAASRYEDLQTLSYELKAVSTPDEQALHAGEPYGTPLAVEFCSTELEACRKELRDTGRALIPLRDVPDAEPSLAATYWHRLLKNCQTDIPRAVFWGGTPQSTYLAVFQQALNSGDFVHLWTI